MYRFYNIYSTWNSGVIHFIISILREVVRLRYNAHQLRGLQLDFKPFINKCKPSCEIIQPWTLYQMRWLISHTDDINEIILTIAYERKTNYDHQESYGYSVMIIVYNPRWRHNGRRNMSGVTLIKGALVGNSTHYWKTHDENNIKLQIHFVSFIASLILAALSHRTTASTGASSDSYRLSETWEKVHPVYVYFTLEPLWKQTKC
jgi:hypothetical protein